MNSVATVEGAKDIPIKFDPSKLSPQKRILSARRSPHPQQQQQQQNSYDFLGESGAGCGAGVGQHLSYPPFWPGHHHPWSVAQHLHSQQAAPHHQNPNPNNPLRSRSPPSQGLVGLEVLKNYFNVVDLSPGLGSPTEPKSHDPSHCINQRTTVEAQPFGYGNLYYYHHYLMSLQLQHQASTNRGFLAFDYAGNQGRYAAALASMVAAANAPDNNVSHKVLAAACKPPEPKANHHVTPAKVGRPKNLPIVNNNGPNSKGSCAWPPPKRLLSTTAHNASGDGNHRQAYDLLKSCKRSKPNNNTSNNDNSFYDKMSYGNEELLRAPNSQLFEPSAILSAFSMTNQLESVQEESRRRPGFYTQPNAINYRSPCHNTSGHNFYPISPRYGMQYVRMSGHNQESCKNGLQLDQDRPLSHTDPLTLITCPLCKIPLQGQKVHEHFKAELDAFKDLFCTLKACKGTPSSINHLTPVRNCNSGDHLTNFDSQFTKVETAPSINFNKSNTLRNSPIQIPPITNQIKQTYVKVRNNRKLRLQRNYLLSKKYEFLMTPEKKDYTISTILNQSHSESSTGTLKSENMSSPLNHLPDPYQSFENESFVPQEEHRDDMEINTSPEKLIQSPAQTFPDRSPGFRMDNLSENNIESPTTSHNTTNQNLVETIFDIPVKEESKSPALSHISHSSPIVE